MAERDFTEIARLSERYNKDPKSRIFVQLADAYRKNNMIEEAFDVLQKGLEHHPDYPLAHLIMGKCRFDKRMFAQAKESFQKTLEFDPQNVVALRMLAQTCEITNDEEGQVAAYKGLLTIDPFDDQAREKLSQLEAKHKKEPMFTLAMAEEYEDQGNLDKALEIYRHLITTDPSDLTLQKRIKAIEDRITEEKKTVEAKKIESMQVETVFKPEQIEEKLKEVQKPQPASPTPPLAPETKERPMSEPKEEVMPLEDFLAESKEGPPVPPETVRPPQPYTKGPDKDIIDEKLDLLEPFKPEEPTDKIEKLDILEPLEADTSSEPAAEIPAAPPEKSMKEASPLKEPTPVSAEPPEEKPAPDEPVPQSVVSETPPPSEPTKEGVIILQPPQQKIPEPTKEGPAVTSPEKTPTIPPAPPPETPPVPEATPAPTPEPAPAPEAAPTPARETTSVPEVSPAPAPETKPAGTPAPAPEPSPAQAPEKTTEEPKPKPKEEDFQSFQDWLSGLIK